MVVTTTVDKNYLRYLFCLVSSIKQNSPSTTVHCRLINIEEQSVADSLRDIMPNIIIENDYSNLSTKRRNLRAKGELLYGKSLAECLSRVYKKGIPRFLCSDLQCYTSNTRFRNIKNLFNAGYKDVIYLDADTIVRKDLEELQPVLSKSDVCCNVSYCTRYPNDRCWECSFLYIKNNSITMSFLEDVRDETESDMFNWDSDQIALETIYSNKYKDILSLEEDISNIEDLSALHGRNLSADSYIWAGSGATKFTNTEFLKELSIYENLLPNK